jgi:hypothetical protein
VTYSNDGECLNLVNQLYGATLSGKWTLDPNRQFQMLVNLVSGIEVTFSEQSAKRTKDAGTALAMALTDEHVLAIAKPVPIADNPPRVDLILIYVGKNPSSLSPISLPK